MKLFISPYCRRKLFGFSLIELLVVIAIIGILAAIGIGNHRRNIARTNVNQEMERFCGAIRELPPTAQAAGELVLNDGSRPQASQNSFNNTGDYTRINGGNCFVWRIYNGKTLVNQGFVGSSDEVAISVTNGLKNSDLSSKADRITKGAWLGIYEGNQDTQGIGNNTSPLVAIAFRPNGTPFVNGKIKVLHYEGKNIHNGVEISIDRMGNVSDKQCKTN